MPVTGGVRAGLVIGIKEAIIPAGLAYLVNPFSLSSSIIPVVGWRNVSLKTP